MHMADQDPIPAALFGEAQAHKLLWANCSARSDAFDRHLADARRSEDMIASLSSIDPESLRYKLLLILDWLDPSQVGPIDMIKSMISDLSPKPCPAATPKPTPVRINRSARPCVVGGILYPSVTAAAQATGISYSTLLKQ